MLRVENNMERWEISHKAEKEFEWRKWSLEIPYIVFPEDWKIKITPPFGSAIVRFSVVLPGCEDKNSVSVYLDCYDILGCFGEPYWEVYPYKNDIARCKMNDVNSLLKYIADRTPSEENEV